MEEEEYEAQKLCNKTCRVVEVLASEAVSEAVVSNTWIFQIF